MRVCVRLGDQRVSLKRQRERRRSDDPSYPLGTDRTRLIDGSCHGLEVSEHLRDAIEPSGVSGSSLAPAGLTAKRMRPLEARTRLDVRVSGAGAVAEWYVRARSEQPPFPRVT